MEKIVRVLVILVCFMPIYASAQKLIISSTLSLELMEPDFISHAGELLVFKFKHWSVSHENIDPKRMYPNVDLSGTLKPYLRSVFTDMEQNLPRWLEVMAKDQANALGVDVSKAIHKRTGAYELLAAYNTLKRQGDIYIFETHQVHRLTVLGSMEDFKRTINKIKER